MTQSKSNGGIGFGGLLLLFEIMKELRKETHG